MAPEQAPDPKQALDLELAPEGQRSSDHLRKIKVPDPELASTPDPTIIWLVIILTGSHFGDF
jgi:hypothetical protein